MPRHATPTRVLLIAFSHYFHDAALRSHAAADDAAICSLRHATPLLTLTPPLPMPSAPPLISYLIFTMMPDYWRAAYLITAAS